MCARLEAEDTADEGVEGDVGDGLRYLSSRLEVGADSLEDGVHLRIFIVEAMPSMEEVLGDPLGTEEDLRAEVCDEYQLTDAGGYYRSAGEHVATGPFTHLYPKKGYTETAYKILKKVPHISVLP